VDTIKDWLNSDDVEYKGMRKLPSKHIILFPYLGGLDLLRELKRHVYPDWSITRCYDTTPNHTKNLIEYRDRIFSLNARKDLVKLLTVCREMTSYSKVFALGWDR
jgi:hypothetical protein